VVPLPITALLWMYVFTKLLYSNKQKILLFIVLIIDVIFVITFFTLLSIDPALIGRVTSPVDANYGFVVTIYQLALLIVFFITGVLIGRESLNSKSPDVTLKGKLLIIAFLSFLMGSVLEIFSGISLVVLIIARVILISSAIEFYGGFLLPQWMKKLISRKKA
jgi:MFS family permease